MHPVVHRSAVDASQEEDPMLVSCELELGQRPSQFDIRDCVRGPPLPGHRHWSHGDQRAARFGTCERDPGETRVPTRWFSGVKPQRILSVVGTRPNFVKMAPVIAALRRRPDEFEAIVVHTGQHYDEQLSQVFLEELEIPAPDYSLGVGSGSHAQQTARVMERLEPVLLGCQPDLVLVPGDVNSTLAAAVVASKLHLPLGHVESGLRSFDRTMPEEVNRVVTDQLSDLLFTHSPEAVEHLAGEGIAFERIHYVGNTMIDTLVALRERIEAEDAAARLGLDHGRYVLVTLHRPALVDGPSLLDTLEHLEGLSDALEVVFPAHPRTRKAMEAWGLRSRTERLHLLEPLGYLEFVSLISTAAAVITDSGGIQEETTFLGVPCFTLRDNTERPITVTSGTNTLLGLAPHRIREVPELLARDHRRPSEPPPLWDGRAAERLVSAVSSSDGARTPERQGDRPTAAVGRP
jgi:UDP-N-acetylglucosamine 2-epimerase (non-hydrolysing)